jgi:hypothetical protein
VRAPRDAGTVVDSGVFDGGTLDASTGDADSFDAGSLDAGSLDAAPEPPETASQPLAEHPGDLIISELMIDPKALSDAEGEWIELYNATDATLELRGCQLDDGAESLHEIPAVLVEAGAFLTIAGEAEPGFSADLLVPLSLTNSADSVAILCQGLEIDRVSYDKAAEFAIAPGLSLALDPAELDAHANDAASAWCAGMDAYATDLGSPGQPNPSCHDAEWEPDAEDEPHDAGAYDAGAYDAGAYDAGETPADAY